MFFPRDREGVTKAGDLDGPDFQSVFVFAARPTRERNMTNTGLDGARGIRSRTYRDGRSYEQPCP